MAEEMKFIYSPKDLGVVYSAQVSIIQGNTEYFIVNIFLPNKEPYDLSECLVYFNVSLDTPYIYNKNINSIISKDNNDNGIIIYGDDNNKIQILLSHMDSQKLEQGNYVGQLTIVTSDGQVRHIGKILIYSTYSSFNL